jgi:hypothetical protein
MTYCAPEIINRRYCFHVIQGNRVLSLTKPDGQSDVFILLQRSKPFQVVGLNNFENLHIFEK